MKEKQVLGIEKLKWARLKLEAKLMKAGRPVDEELLDTKKDWLI